MFWTSGRIWETKSGRWHELWYYANALKTPRIFENVFQQICGLCEAFAWPFQASTVHRIMLPTQFSFLDRSWGPNTRTMPRGTFSGGAAPQTARYQLASGGNATPGRSALTKNLFLLNIGRRKQCYTLTKFVQNKNHKIPGRRRQCYTWTQCFYSYMYPYVSILSQRRYTNANKC